MKKLLVSALLALTSIAFGATTTPVQLLNPTGSTAGQAILSTGPSSPPAWGTVTLSGVSGTLAITNGGTGATSASAARTNLGVPALTGAQFTGALSLAYGQPSVSWLDTNQTNGLGRFRVISSANAFSIFRNTATAGDFSTSTQPLTFNGSDVATFLNRPVFGAATPWDSANLPSPVSAASPTFTGTVTTAALTASGLITPSSTVGIKGTATNDNAQSGSVGEYQEQSATGTALTTSTNTNTTSITLPAGDWRVQVNNKFNIAAGATVTSAGSTVTLTSAGGATLGQTTFNSGISATNAIGVVYVTTPVVRFSLSATTTIYATGIAVFSGGSVTVDGKVTAWRPR
ncbi:hypothetical protein AWB71_03320 [Caballeronia peredens]|nr:hypothetical protein AWB71_03320 [Caballeronia peredens]